MNTERTSLFLMANLGAEVARLLHYVAKKDMTLAHAAYKRSQKIIDAITVHPDMASRREEVEKIRMVIDDFMKERQELSVSPQDFQNYFIPFSARLLRQG